MKDIRIDRERKEVAASIESDEPTVILISEGKAKAFKLHEFGEFTVKTQNGKVAIWENTEKGKM